MDRPQHFRFHRGQKQLPFADAEYEARLKIFRQTMQETGVDACVLTSMHNVSYYSGFLYCSFAAPMRKLSQRPTPSPSALGLTRRNHGADAMATISRIQTGKDIIIGGPFFPSLALAKPLVLKVTISASAKCSCLTHF